MSAEAARAGLEQLRAAVAQARQTENVVTNQADLLAELLLENGRIRNVSTDTLRSLKRALSKFHATRRRWRK